MKKKFTVRHSKIYRYGSVLSITVRCPKTSEKFNARQLSLPPNKKEMKIHREAPYKIRERHLLVPCISEIYSGAFAHSREAPSSFIISFRLSVRMYRLRFRRTGYSSSSYICHGVGPLVHPFRSHASRSLFKGLP
jgi:hypothetical protein